MKRSVALKTVIVDAENQQLRFPAAVVCVELQSDDDRLIVGVLKVLNDNLIMTFLERAHWREFKCRTEDQLLPLLDLNRKYAGSSITHPDIDLRDKSGAPAEFSNIKRIWRGKRVLLVGGRESRLGVGNNLFAEAT